MLGIVMSSQASIINAGSTVFTKDIIQPLNEGNKMSNKKQITLSIIATILIGIFGLISSLT